jgi:hypothetical protein
MMQLTRRTRKIAVKRGMRRRRRGMKIAAKMIWLAWRQRMS